VNQHHAGLSPGQSEGKVWRYGLKNLNNPLVFAGILSRGPANWTEKELRAGQLLQLQQVQVEAV
jgi:hypothetical protein